MIRLCIVLGLAAVLLVQPTGVTPAAGAPGEISYVGAASTQGNRTSHAVTVPSAVQAGDVLVLSLTTNSTGSTIADSLNGWTLEKSRDGNGIRGRLWTRIATGSDAGSTVTVTTSDLAKGVLSVAAYRSTGSAPTVSATTVRGSDSPGTSHPMSEIAVAGAGSWLVGVWSEKTSSALTWTLPSDMTQRTTATSTGSGKVSAVLGDFAAAVPEGPSAPVATTDVSASRSVVFGVVITPGEVITDNEPPTAAFTASCDELACSFDASGSSDPENATLTYSWDFGDGQTGNGETAQHTYASGGQRTVKLTVSDGVQADDATEVVDPQEAIEDLGELEYVGAASTGGNRSAHTVRIPAAVEAGDILLLSLTTNTTTTSVGNPPAGWTLLESRDGSGIRGRLYTKTATAQDANTDVTLTSPSIIKSTLGVAAYRSTGADPTVSASEVGGSNSTTSSHPSPQVPVAEPGSWLVNVWSEKSSSTVTWSLPGNVTERTTATGTGTSKISAVFGDSGTSVPTGTAASRTATTNVGVSRTVNFSVVLDPGQVVNAPPEASFTAVCTKLVCSFDASASSDPENADLTYSWDFGDGTSGNGETAEHTYSTSGPRTVTLTVDDGELTEETTRDIDPQEDVAPGLISHVGSVTTAGNRPAHSLTIPQSVKPGDLMLLFLVTNSTSTTINDALQGWELLESRDGSGTRGRVWARNATAADAGSVVNISGSGYAKSVMSLSAYRSTGPARVSASAIRGVDTSSSSHTTPVSNADKPNSWLVNYWAEKSSTATTWTLPSDSLSRTQGEAAGNGKVSGVLGDSDGTIPQGNVPGRTATTSTSVTRSVLFSVVLDPGTDATETNEPPVAEFTSGCAGMTCEFDASLSYDLDEDDLTYQWDFGDGTTGNGVNPSHTYATTGTRVVTLTVDDGNGHTDQATGTATAVSQNPAPGHTRLVPDAPRTNQPTITDGEIWDIEIVGNIAYVAGTFPSIRQPNNGTIINQPSLAAYNWSTGAVLTTFRPTFTNGGVVAVEASPDGSKLYIAGDFGTVNGQNKKAIARVNPTTGAPIETFTANTNGKVNELAVTNSTVYVGGRFTLVNNVPRGALAALDGETGAVRTDFVNNITGGIGTNGELAVQRLKLSRDEGRLLVVHTGRQVNGQNRYGVAIINARTNKLTPWKTTLWEDNLQFVGGIQRVYAGDISPDGTRFVVASGSGGDRPPINDTVIVFNLNDDSDAQPVWISRHFDSVYSAVWTEAGIYIGGHFQWGEDISAPIPWPGLDDVGYGTGQGLSAYALGDAVVKRFHLAALDPADGHALEWFAPSNSYEGDKHIEAHPRGIFVGGDGNTKGGYNVGRIGFFDFNNEPAQNSTQTQITDPIEGRIKPEGEQFEITGTATAASGINRVEVEIMDRNSGRYLSDDLTTWGSTTVNTFEATLDPGTGANRTWRLPVTITGNRELQVRARAVASGGTADNTKAAKKFETFGVDDLPPDANVTGPGSPVNALTFTITGNASDDVGVNSVSLTMRDTQGRYLQDDGTVSGTFNTFNITPDVVGAIETTWSYEVTVPFEDEWWAQVRATDTAGQSSLDTSDRRWIVTENGQPPTVSITEPVEMIPPTSVQAVQASPGSPMTFAGSANDDEGLREVSITMRNNTTGERLAADGTWGANVIAGSHRISPANLNQTSYNWSWTTPFNLTPGTYSFTVSAEDHIGLGTSSTNQGRLTISVTIPGDNPPDARISPSGTINGLQTLHLDLAGTATDAQGVAKVLLTIEENDSSRYLTPTGQLTGLLTTIDAVMATPGGTSTAWTYSVDLPIQGDWRITVSAIDTSGQVDPSTSGATARYPIYPGDQPPVLNEGLLSPTEGTEFPDGKIFVSGRAEDDQAMQEVEVAIVNAAGQYMSSSGGFTSTNQSWRTAFLNSPGTPGSNFSYTTPVIPPGAYTVRVRAIDHHDFVGPIYERHATVTHPPNNPPVPSFTMSCAENVCSYDARASTDENALTLTYDWEFGDGDDDDGPVVSHTYDRPGTFTVELTARDEWGITATVTQQVTIVEPTSNVPPNPVINPPACSALRCNFSAVGSSDPNPGDRITYRWDWGDGTAASTSTSPSHTFPVSGTYTVSLTVTDGWGKATTVTRNVTVSSQ